MTEINRHNYEEFFLDYLEGTLSSLQRIALEDFLNMNPDLRLELEEMECPVLLKDNIQVDSEFLKEIPFRESFDDFCIARLEGDLSVENEIAFDKFLKNNESFKTENEIYKKTILVPDYKLVFIDKQKLKRSSRKVAFWWYFSRIGVAASIILLFSLWSILYQFENDFTNEERITAKIETAATEIKKINKIEDAIKVEKLEVQKQKYNLPEQKADPKSRNQVVEVNLENKIPVHKEEKKVKRIDPLDLSLNTKLIAIANPENLAKELNVLKKESSEIISENNGLAQIGMAWKSSVPEKKAQGSVLFAIAKYGVDKLGEIAGKNVQLEKKYDSTTEKTRLDFNTTGIGFSKTIK